MLGVEYQYLRLEHSLIYGRSVVCKLLSICVTNQQLIFVSKYLALYNEEFNSKVTVHVHFLPHRIISVNDIFPAVATYVKYQFSDNTRQQA